MSIFKYEFRQLRNSIITWSICLSAVIIFLFPVITTVADSETISFSEMLGAYANNDFFSALNIDVKSLSSPIGGYSYILSVVVIAFAMLGCRMGLSALSKEWNDKTFDFLMTKPYSRLKIYLSKVFAGIAALVIVGIVFFIISWLILFLTTNGQFDFKVLILLASTAPLLCFVYFCIGMLVGATYPQLKSPSIIAMGIAFITYVISAFSRVMKIPAFIYLSPYTYFDSNIIRETANFELKSYILLMISIVFVIIGYFLFKNKDIVTER